jgi:hypothetical protein
VVIEYFTSGCIVIHEVTYTADVIIWPEGVDDARWRLEGHRLAKEDLEPILNKEPDILIIGTGPQGELQVPADVIDYMEQCCEQVYVEPTEQACARYNDVCDKPLRVTAGLHLTC